MSLIFQVCRQCKGLTGINKYFDGHTLGQSSPWGGHHCNLLKVDKLPRGLSFSHSIGANCKEQLPVSHDKKSCLVQTQVCSSAVNFFDFSLQCELRLGFKLIQGKALISCTKTGARAVLPQRACCEANVSSYFRSEPETAKKSHFIDQSL